MFRVRTLAIALGATTISMLASVGAAQASQCAPEPRWKPKIAYAVWACTRWVSRPPKRCTASPGYQRGFIWVCDHWERPRARPSNPAGAPGGVIVRDRAPGPVIRDQRGGPVIRDQRGPVIRDQRGPVIRDQRTNRYFTDPHF